MNAAEIIRLLILAVAILLGYHAIVNLVDFVGSFPNGKFPVSLLLRAAAFAVGSWMLIKYNRKIAYFIDRQR